MTRVPFDWVTDPNVQRNFDRISMELRQPVPQARVYNSGNLSVANSTDVALTFDSERFDVGGLHSTSGNTSRLTVSVAGAYMIGAHMRFASNATGYRRVSLVSDGTTTIATEDKTAVNGAATDFSLSAFHQFAAGQYVEVFVFQTSGGALNVESGAQFSPEFWMVRVAGFESQAFTG